MKENNEKTNLCDVESRPNDNQFWFDKFRQILALRYKLYQAAILGAIIGLFIAFCIPKEYFVSVTLSPESNNNKSANGLMSLASSFLGNSISSNDNDALNVLLAPEIVTSTPFLLELLNSKVVDEEQDKEISLSEYLEHLKRPWWQYIVSAPRLSIGYLKSLLVKEPVFHGEKTDQSFITLDKMQYMKLEEMRSRLFALLDKKTGVIAIELTLQDPVVTATIADSVVSKLQKYIVNYKITKAEEDCEYWKKITKESKFKYIQAQREYADFVDSNNNSVYQSAIVERERLQNEVSLALQVYSQVSQQFQMSQVKLQESKPAFTIIEPSVVPLRSKGISKLFFLITYIFLSVFCVLVWYLFILPYREKIKQICSALS